MKGYNNGVLKDDLLGNITLLKKKFDEKMELLKAKIEDSYDDQGVIIFTDEVYEVREIIGKFKELIESF